MKGFRDLALALVRNSKKQERLRIRRDQKHALTALKRIGTQIAFARQKVWKRTLDLTVRRLDHATRAKRRHISS